MKLLFGLMALFILVIGLALAQPIAERYDSDSAHRRQLQYLDEQRRQLDLERYQQTQAARISSDYVWTLMTLVAAAAGIVIVLDFYRWRRQPVIKFAGYPVARSAIERGELVDIMAEALRANGIAQIEEARRALPPHVYSPHLTYKLDGAPALVGGDTPSSLSSVPTFADLLARGRVGRGSPLVLGFDVETGAELSGSWLDLYSTAVSGMPGSGKTTSQRFLACQTALHGAKFAICDPHAGAADDSLAATLAPLSSAFICEPASADRQILDVVRYVADVGRRRVQGGDGDTTPLILWVDELTALLGRSSIADDLTELMERIAQEYRKRHVFLCASGQIWTAARTTSELRDSFASVLCHRMKRAQARLLLPTDEAEQVERLQTGRAVLWRTSGVTQVVTIPNTTAADCMRVASLLATSWLPGKPESSHFVADPMPPNMPLGSQSVATGDWLRSAPASAEAARAASLFLGGMDLSALVWELRGIRSSQGGKYQQALTEVQALVRAGLSR